MVGSVVVEARWLPDKVGLLGVRPARPVVPPEGLVARVLPELVQEPELVPPPPLVRGVQPLPQ